MGLLNNIFYKTYKKSIDALNFDKNISPLKESREKLKYKKVKSILSKVKYKKKEQ